MSIGIVAATITGKLHRDNRFMVVDIELLRRRPRYLDVGVASAIDFYMYSRSECRMTWLAHRPEEEGA
jgi:hypothetical protein